jgi:hypothetical protein
MYTDQLRVEDLIGRELSDQEASGLDTLIGAVSIQIDTYTGRSWSPVDESDDGDLEASERYFDGTGSKEVWVDDFIGLEKVEILDSTGGISVSLTEETDWQTFPPNKNPKNSVRLRSYRFPNDVGNVRITAIWGGGSPPADVIAVCTELVGKYMVRSAETGPFKRESIEGYSKELLSDTEFIGDSSSVLSKLDHYKKIVL